MRAFVVESPGSGRVDTVERPEPGPGEAVIAVRRVGLCGTDLEFFRGTQPNLAAGTAAFPMRLGHEWSGRVVRVGEGVAEGLVGARVTGETMLGCGRCEVCLGGTPYLCPDRTEVGVLGGRAGALADELLMPAGALHRLPDAMNDAVGALVEPASLSLRAVRTLDLAPSASLLVWGLGAIGLLVVGFAAAAGLEVHAVGRSRATLDLALQLGARTAGTEAPAGRRFDGAVAGSPDAAVPTACVAALRPGGRLAAFGISGFPSSLEVRDLVLGDITVFGLMSGSPYFADAVDALASAAFDADLLIGDVLPLERSAEALSGIRHSAGPKTQIAVAG
jgi:threonine dehydrogenase-like Zn-dependent dehydrogenase